MRKTKNLGHYHGGTGAEWYEGRTLTVEQRELFRQVSYKSKEARKAALRAVKSGISASRPVPRFDADTLSPQISPNGITSLSLFSGGGGLDLGIDRAGFEHVASYEVLTDAGQTLKVNRPHWRVFCGEEGDVRKVDWRVYRGEIGLLHGGPPCQPFSMAGRQRGQEDSRDLFPEFIRAVTQINPRAFLVENVPALMARKFRRYVTQRILKPLSTGYHLVVFQLDASDFGVPQVRRRVFIVGFRNRREFAKFRKPQRTHDAGHLRRDPGVQMPLAVEFSEENGLRPCMGAREALGLDLNGFDCLCPTLRSGLTGPRHTTSVLSSVSALRVWERLGIWPNGVSVTPELASAYPGKNGNFRLCVRDCALLQGFPEQWRFQGAVYSAIGQIGNSVAPPVAYRVALAISTALR